MIELRWTVRLPTRISNLEASYKSRKHNDVWNFLQHFELQDRELRSAVSDQMMADHERGYNNTRSRFQGDAFGRDLPTTHCGVLPSEPTHRGCRCHSSATVRGQPESTGLRRWPAVHTCTYSRRSRAQPASRPVQPSSGGKS